MADFPIADRKHKVSNAAKAALNRLALRWRRSIGADVRVADAANTGIRVGDAVAERGMHLGQEFGDHVRPRDRRKAFGNQNRSLPGRVEDEEVLTPLPDPFLH